jgi:hypothetical protein
MRKQWGVGLGLLWMMLLSLVSRQQAGVNNSSASAKSTQGEFGFKVFCELETKRAPTYSRFCIFVPHILRIVEHKGV